MEVVRTVTVNISPDELEDIVKEYLKREGFEPNDAKIDFKVSSHIEGYGYGEHEVKTFDGCNVVCKIKKER